MMRRVLLASSALALLSGAAYAADTVVYVPPAPPAPPAPVQGPAGYVEAGYGWVNIDDGFGGELNLDQIFIGGAANIPFGAWNFQLEVRDHQYLDGAILNTLATNLHIYSRNQSFAWGGFVGFETLSGIIDNYTVGLEAAGFFGPFTVVGQATYASLDPAVGPGSADLWTVRGVARYFVNPDLKLEAGLRYSNLSSGGVDVDFLTAEAEVEYKFGAAAVFGNAQYLFGGDLDPASVLALRLGARIHLGAASLLDQDRNGAGTFDTNPWLLP
jgi:opacity protein-like surface antigen